MARQVYPGALTWAEVDPARCPLSDDDVAALRDALLRCARDENAYNDVVIARCGDWASGWRWAGDEGSIGGGVVHAWCCASHSIKGSDAEVVDRVVGGLQDWRAWLTHLADLFTHLAPRDDDVTGRLARALTEILAEVSQATSCGDAWYNHAEQVLGWYLERWGASAAQASEAVGHACAGIFESWVSVPEATAERMANDLAADAARFVDVVASDDDLGRHRAVRRRLDPASTPASRPSIGRIDGHARYIDDVDGARDPERAVRMHNAVRVARDLARGGVWVDLDLVRQLHDVAVEGAVGFRGAAAFAKAGRERYGFSDDVIAACNDALGEADDGNLPLMFRAARAYLDVLFFHPFVDGNARAARLVFDFICFREGVVLDDVGALFRFPIKAGDLEVAQAFIRLTHELAAASLRRAQPGATP